MSNRALVSVLLAFAVVVPAAHAQSARHVALVINDASADSVRIGEHYARVRAVPAENIIHLSAPTSDAIARARYVAEIETPIAAALRRHNLQDQVLYVVLTKGIPLRIDGTTGQEGTIASVDAELTLLYRRMTGRDAPVRGRIANPYFLGALPIADARPFSHRRHDIYLVTRLTAFTADEAIALIDRAQTPSRDGQFVLDQRAGVFANPVGDRQLAAAHQRLRELGVGDRAQLEETTNAARALTNVLGYYSWGSNDPEQRGQRRTTMTFAPGALAALFVSGDARTFDEPPAAWQPTGDFKNRASWFQGSPQSLTADLIRDGVTGAAGHVAEPYLQSAVRPDILFPAYVSGFNLAEAFYLAIPDLSWQTVVVGDPLCAPFPRRATSDDFDVALDPETELPIYYAGRRLEVAQTQLKGVPAAAVAQYLRAETRIIRGDNAGARAPLVAATTSAPDFAAAHLQLALLHEEAQEYDQARTRYEAVLKAQPNNLVALNNLAYTVGVREGATADALPYARRAFTLAPTDPRIADTYAWIAHLAGQSDTAARTLRPFAPRDTGVAELHLHAAVIFAAVGDLREAARQLDLAIARDGALADSAEARGVRAQVRK